VEPGQSGPERGAPAPAAGSGASRPEDVGIDVARRTEERLEAVLAHGRDAVVVVGLDGVVRWASGSVRRVLGRDPNELGDRWLADLSEVNPDDVVVAELIWAEASASPGSTASARVRLRHADGTWRWVEVGITNRTDVLGRAGMIVNLHDVTEHQRAHDELRYQAQLLASIGEAVVGVDPNDVITYWNDAATTIFGWSAEEAIGRTSREVFRVRDDDVVRAACAAALARGDRWCGEMEAVRRDGSTVHIRSTTTPVHDAGGRLLGLIGTSTDTSDQVTAASELATRASMQAVVAELGQFALTASSVDVVLDRLLDAARAELDLSSVSFLDREGGSWQVRAASTLDVSFDRVPVPEEKVWLIEEVVGDLDGPHAVVDVHDDDRLRRLTDGVVSSVVIVGLDRPDRPAGVELLMASSRDPRRWRDDEVDFIRSLGNIVAASLQRDDDQRELVSQALHDPLTGLPNRTLLLDRIEHASARSERSGRHLAVLLVDLDGFKLINDAHGHLVGDELLVAVAERLTAVMRGGDTVARLGGDEFAVLCEDVGSVGDADRVAARLAEAMAEPFGVGDGETYVTASIGITVRSGRQASPDLLLREADAAMYRAKETGRARHELYDDDMRDRAVRRLGLTNDLRRAAPRGELELLWQPEVPIAADPASGVWAEALVRWNHPVLGLLAPDAFIGLAEQSGLIADVDQWVLGEACRTLRAWEDSGGPVPAMISVNVSARHLSSPTVVESFRDAVRAADIDPTRIMLELTETAVMVDQQLSMERLEALAALGFGLAIDDFGTGYSSLTYLRRLPVSALKVDRSFVSGLGESLEDRAIVEGIVDLAHALGLVTIAEGVESEAQRLELRELGTDWAQGYLWSRPVPPAQLQAWLATTAAGLALHASGAG
jgi:diguanylate cyclase (GGDEF)-like protein/PAS domain S-box-containing protein